MVDRTEQKETEDMLYVNMYVRITMDIKMYQLSCLEEIGCKILQNVKIPQHIGLIVDGNRRYAKN